jgi:hypothetical protein
MLTLLKIILQHSKQSTNNSVKKQTAIDVNDQYLNV